MNEATVGCSELMHRSNFFFIFSWVPNLIAGTVPSLSTDNAWVDSVSEPSEIIITPQLVVSKPTFQVICAVTEQNYINRSREG
jgi:hypothetical protein